MDMITKSSFEIGTGYEEKVYEYLESILEDDNVPGASRYSQLKFHPKYYDEFGTSVNPDISIEVFRSSDSVTPSSIIIFECKNVSRKLDISDYNEFQANLTRIRRSGVKGFIVTPVGFPESAILRSKGLNTGFASGIGLIVFNDNGADWIVERNIRTYAAHINKMKILKGESISTHPVMFIDGAFINPIYYFIKSDVNVKGVLQPYVPYLSDLEIENIANSVGNKFLPISCGRIETILKHIEPGSTIIDKLLPADILASYDFEDEVLSISSDLKNNLHRRNFSIAHEIGHIVLHKKILKDFFANTSYNDCKLRHQPSESIISSLEIQANKFASYILLPSHILLVELKRRKQALGMNLNKPLYWD